MTQADREWDKRARQLEFDQLPSLRSTAEKWRNALGALTGTLATVAVVKGAETVDDLTQSGRLLALSLLGAAFAFLIIASLCAMRAAFSTPDQIIDSAEDLRAWTTAEVARSASFLKAAQILTPLALLLLVSGQTTVWINGPAEKPKMNFMVQLKDGSQICGEPGASAGGVLTVKIGGANNQLLRVSLASVDSLTLSSC